MQTFKYRAQSEDGAKVKGVIESMDEYTAVDRIREEYPILLEITPVKEKKSIFSMEIGKKFEPKSLSVMCSQFKTILSAGVDIAESMRMVAEQTKNKKLKAMLEKSAIDVSGGNGIATSFEKNFDGLPVTFVETVRAGEMSGNIEDSFATLEKYYSRSYKLKEKIKQAMAYPIFVVIIAIIVLVIVMTKVMPVLTAMFDDMGGQLPKMTQFMINSSLFWAKWWMLVLAVIVAVIIALKLWEHTEKGMRFFSRLKLLIPVMGPINKCRVSSEFAFTMSTLLKAGLPVTDALEVTSKVIDNYVFQLGIEKIRESVETGKRLSDSMNETEIFPGPLTGLTGIGEETGELEATLANAGDYYANEGSYRVKQAISRLEPTMLVILAIFAGFIVISIYLPMFTMYDMM